MSPIAKPTKHNNQTRRRLAVWAIYQTKYTNRHSARMFDGMEAIYA